VGASAVSGTSTPAFPPAERGAAPSAQILCVSYAQDLADKLARDCRSIMMSPWYRQIFRTRLAAHRNAVQEFITTCHGSICLPTPST
jgi:hypothetical protein